MSELEKARLEVMKAVGYVQKGGKNTQQHYNYASEGDLIRGLRKAMIDNGLTLTPAEIKGMTVERVELRNSTMIMPVAVVRYELRHVSGESMSVEVCSSGADSIDKGTFKLMTGAEKYALRQAFLIETGDDPEKDLSPAEERSAERPGLSEDGLTELAVRFKEADTLQRLKEVWDDYKLNEYVDASDKDRSEVQTYKDTRKRELENTNA